MPESGSLGSVRGATSNGRSYRETSDDASKVPQTASKLKPPTCSRKSVAGTCLLATRCPVYRRRDSHSGFRTELENLADDAKGKRTSGGPARLKVPMRRAGADCSVVVVKRGNARGAKGAGHRHWEVSQLVTG